MKLSVNFNMLKRAVNLMEPEVEGEFHLELEETTINKIDTELAQGKDVELKDVDIDSGLLSYQGRQVLLYIKDHGNNVQNVIHNPEMGNRFHVTDCSKLKSMRSEGRFERYVVINDTSGEFPISGQNYHSRQLDEGKAKLKVCKFCLGQLNYQGYSSGGNRNSIFDGFDMSEFFQTYSSFFPHMPARAAETAQTGYTDDWSKVSSRYRVENNFECKECGVNLRSNRPLLHVHHMNGVKSDNRPDNLKALCIDCHSKQPLHSHMVLSHSERQQINDLRNKQGLLEGLGHWKAVFDYSDPGVHGVLHACRKQSYMLPEVAHYIRDDFDEPIARLELAWPKHKFGVAIANIDIEEAQGLGWQIVSAHEFLENYRSHGNILRS
ncbi:MULTISPECIES: HNH endonuclease [Vibrio]|uniref:HNH endonuclease n=1 Tax=Vibrio TaxID=662 RepID=UPI002075FFE0|nr:MULTISPECIES: HNH endonuclease [Vibrio]USD31271.1 HNH endonuclease [Vibrio sp. SCSIO 43186]USD44317.1 HNH endonuclease [Vibrio sp. SCSIO 43145]USD68394.1 HNH endonuclease [Vibrio sp. SCSIO 43139]USD96080.1 HNH endonuclease [Vibrio coralliilyticus]